MPMLRINLRIALKALTHNKLQALLTLCGMSVGVAMVVIVAGLGQGAQSTIEAQLDSAGPTEITIRAGNFVPAAVITTGEQDSSGGEPGEGSQSPFDSQSSGTKPNAATAPNAPRPGMMRHRTPAPPLGDAELRVVKTNVANVRAVAASVEGNVRLTDDLAPALAASAAPVPATAAASASASALATSATSGSPAASASAPASASATAVAVRVVRARGVDSAWQEIRGWKIVAGRAIEPQEYDAAAPVALLTPGAARRLWPNSAGAAGTAAAAQSAADALNRTVRAAGHDVRIVGILKPSTNASDSESETAVVPTVYMPLGLAQELLGRRTFDTITVRTASVGSTTAVATEIRSRLRQLRELPSDTLDDFRVETQSLSAMPGRGIDPRLARAVHANVVGFEQASYEEISKSLRQAGRTLTLLLAGAATVSLVVGGIGVMNIMLVSVAARTREIGLRMAMGARTGDVLTQFLAEAIALASLGGIVGLALGSAGLAIARHGLRWSTTISPGMLMLALSVAALTGVAFGLGPARRAAALEPVVALRCE